MVNRRRILVGKISHMGTLFWITVVNIASFTLIIAFIGVFSVYNRYKIGDEVSILRKAVSAQNDIVSAIGLAASKIAPVGTGYDRVRQDHQQSMMSIHSHIKSLEEQTDIIFYLFVIITAIALLTAGIYFFYVIYLTSRISGPIQVISGHIQDMIEGREPQFRGLRKRDEFKDLYNKVVELGEKMKTGMEKRGG